MTDTRWINFNGALHKADEPLVPAESRSVRYGDGCFETLRCYSGKFLKLAMHIERMTGGLEYLGITPPDILVAGKLKSTIRLLLDKNGLLESGALARIQVWREGARGFDATGMTGSGYSVSVCPLPVISKQVRLVTVATRRIPAVSVDPGFKLSNSINYIKATAEAKERQADDALMLTVDGLVSETPIANIFWMEGGTVRTPSRSCDILPGITRSLIVKAVAEMEGVSLETGEFTPGHLRSAEAVWISNSVREMVPVAAVDDVEYQVDHPLVARITSAFQSYRNRELK